MSSSKLYQSLDDVIKEKKKQELLAKRIAGKLKELKVNLLYNVIDIAGEEVANAVLKETLKVEEKGGVLAVDGRRRTAGGAYFTLLKQYVSKEQYKAIYKEEEKRKRKQRNKIRQRKRQLLKNEGNNKPAAAAIKENENPRFQSMTD